MPEIVQQIGAILFLVCGLGLSVIIHEYFHMRAALLRGMKVERFAIGFGPKLASFRRGGVEYVVGMLPFGGYVLLPQMNPGEDGKPRTEDGAELPQARPGDRIVVALAGPLGNLVLAVGIACIIWKLGVERMVKPEGLQVIKLEHGSPEAAAGLRNGDRLVTCNGRPCRDGQSLFNEYVFNPEVSLEILRDGRKIVIGPFAPRKNPDAENLKLPSFGTMPILPPVVGMVSPDSVAASIGLQAGDRIVEINHRPVNYWSDISANLNLCAQEPDLPVQVLFKRGDDVYQREFLQKIQLNHEVGLTFIKFPRVAMVDNRSPAFKAGMQPGDEIIAVGDVAIGDVQVLADKIKANTLAELPVTIKRNGREMLMRVQVPSKFSLLGVGLPSEVVHQAPLAQLIEVCTTSWKSLSALFQPKSGIGVEHLTGVVGMANGIYNSFLQSGLAGGLTMLLMINIALGLFNLLPFPVLDGGHIVIAALEIIGRRQVSPRLLIPIYNVFILLVLALMIFVLFNDIRRVTTKAIQVSVPSQPQGGFPC
ncbi:MAG: hypothetical protein RL095_358 [Verrucomicrobiota bacterium]|jgi:regulator of sigma E protease